MGSWTVNPGIATTLGVLGNITALGLFLAPVSTFQTIFRKQDTGDFSAIPYILTFFNCGFWTYYGVITPGGTLIWTINGAGACFEAVYLSLFLVFAGSKIKYDTLKLIGAGFAFYFFVLVLNEHSVAPEKKSSSVGLVADVITCCMYAAPLSVVGKVVQTQSVEFMPLPLSLIGFINSIVWGCYAICVGDIYVLVPNAVGIILGAVQLTIYWMYSKKPIGGGEAAHLLQGSEASPVVTPVVRHQGGRRRTLTGQREDLEEGDVGLSLTSSTPS